MEIESYRKFKLTKNGEAVFTFLFNLLSYKFKDSLIQ